MTIRDNRNYIRVLLYFYYTTITGWGVLLINLPHPMSALYYYSILGLYRGYIGIMEKKMEITIVSWGYIGDV